MSAFPFHMAFKNPEIPKASKTKREAKALRVKLKILHSSPFSVSIHSLTRRDNVPFIRGPCTDPRDLGHPSRSIAFLWKLREESIRTFLLYNNPDRNQRKHGPVLPKSKSNQPIII
jgi:hypothetical protein